MIYIFIHTCIPHSLFPWSSEPCGVPSRSHLVEFYHGFDAHFLLIQRVLLIAEKCSEVCLEGRVDSLRIKCKSQHKKLFSIIYVSLNKIFLPKIFGHLLVHIAPSS